MLTKPTDWCDFNTIGLKILWIELKRYAWDVQERVKPLFHELFFVALSFFFSSSVGRFFQSTANKKEKYR